MRSNQVPFVALLAFIVPIISVDCATRASTWTGATNAAWSNAGNWIGGVPDGSGATVTISIGTTPAHINQNIVAGVTVSSIDATVLSSSDPKFLIDGNSINLSGGGTISHSAQPFVAAPLVVQAPIQLLGTATLTNSAQAVDSTKGLYANLLYDVNGPGNVTSTGVGYDNVILRPAYTGTTTVRSGLFRVGGSIATGFNSYQYFQANSLNQGDYTIMIGATLTGMGTIGLASGGKVTLAGGKLIPGAGDYLGLGEDGGIGRSLHINGDLIVGDGALCGANFLSPGSTIIDVNGLLDLRGAGDQLAMYGPINLEPAGSYVVMEYENRLGSFDILPTTNGAHVTYTSAENSGPGQVIITIPEPTGAAFSAATLLVLLRRRHSSRVVR